MLVGIDFDNTLINYDKVFYSAALEKGLIPSSVTKTKKGVRDYLRSIDMEKEWTYIQGEVYGAKISEAELFEYALEMLCRIKDAGIALYIISHKTRVPYSGQKYDLHFAARSWLVRNGFFDSNGLNLSDNKVIFEVTKQSKIDRIKNIGCTHYIDDLPEILESLPDSVNKILFDPYSDLSEDTANYKIMRSWKNLPDILS